MRLLHNRRAQSVSLPPGTEIELGQLTDPEGHLIVRLRRTLVFVRP
jgi:hypothetical protein